MVNDSTRAIRRPRRAWSPTARTAATIIATASLAFSAAAYGSSPSSTGPGGAANARASADSQSTNTQKLLAFSRCMRSHGVPNYPDPTSSGAIPKVSGQQASSPQFQAAQRACQNLLPAGTNDQFPPGEVRLLLIGMLRFSRCMRSHGVPNWPDPTTDVEGRPEFPLSHVPGTNRNYWHSPRINRVGNECRYQLPSALGGIPVG
jgi:hypothetical protein